MTTFFYPELKLFCQSWISPLNTTIPLLRLDFGGPLVVGLTGTVLQCRQHMERRKQITVSRKHNRLESVVDKKGPRVTAAHPACNGWGNKEVWRMPRHFKYRVPPGVHGTPGESDNTRGWANKRVACHMVHTQLVPSLLCAMPSSRWAL